MPARPFSEPILHVDMDAFYVEVERLRDPSLAGVPVVVGGLGNRGVVASASYEARKYGIHSALPTARARRLCPHARFVPPDHRRYRETSVRVFAVFRSFTPLVEGLSLDEAFLDVSGLRLHFESAEEVGRAVRESIRDQLQLPASVGIATNKLLAKLASEHAKPDGLFRIPAGAELGFLHPLSVRQLWGVGEATYAALEALGVATIGELCHVPFPTLQRRLGDALAHHLHQLAGGIDPRKVVADSEAKSVSVEHTFETDLMGDELVRGELLRLSDRLAGRLRRSGLAGRTVTVKVRLADFTTVTRSTTLEGAIDVTHDIYGAALTLTERIDLSRPVRLLGIGVAALQDGGGPRQLGLERPATRDALASAVDAVRERFGADAVEPARLVVPPGGRQAVDPGLREQ